MTGAENTCGSLLKLLNRSCRRAIAGHVTVRGREAEAKTQNLDIGGHKSAGRSHQKDGDAGGVE